MRYEIEKEELDTSGVFLVIAPLLVHVRPCGKRKFILASPTDYFPPSLRSFGTLAWVNLPSMYILATVSYKVH
jgi:hypothetical protein